MKTDGPQLDSQLRQVRFLFDNIQMGLGFVRSALNQQNTARRSATLAFARHAHDSTVKLAATAPLTDDDRKRLQIGLDELLRAIEAGGQRR